MLITFHFRNFPDLSAPGIVAPATVGTSPHTSGFCDSSSQYATPYAGKGTKLISGGCNASTPGCAGGPL